MRHYDLNGKTATRMYRDGCALTAMRAVTSKGVGGFTSIEELQAIYKEENFRKKGNDSGKRTPGKPLDTPSEIKKFLGLHDGDKSFGPGVIDEFFEFPKENGHFTGVIFHGEVQ